MRQLIDKISIDDDIKLLGVLWLHTKFSSQEVLSTFVINMAYRWKQRDWLARQFCATFPRLTEQSQIGIVNIVYTHGLLRAKSVIDNYKILLTQHRYTKGVMPYLTALNSFNVYPLYKVLIATIVYQSENKPQKDILKNTIIPKIKDFTSRLIIKHNLKRTKQAT